MNQKVELRHCLTEFGYLSLLCLSEDLIDEEKYLEAGMVIDTIREFNRVKGEDLPEQYGQEAIDYFFKTMNDLGFSGEVSYENMPEYVKTIRKRLNI